MRKFLALGICFLSLAKNCLAKDLEFTLTHKRAVKDAAFQMLSELGFGGESDLDSLNAYAQKHLLRPANAERWEVYDDKSILEHREIILKTMGDLGFFDEIKPDLHVEYDHVLILGASVGRMRSRLAFLQQLVSQGLKYKNLYFLTGERPLDPKIEDESSLYQVTSSNYVFKEDWKRPKELPKTESEGARLAWEQLVGSDLEPPEYVDVEMQGNKRPSTVDTINAWLAKGPNKGRTLVISNNPYVPYQHAVVLGTLMKAGFITPEQIGLIASVGPSAKPENERLRVLLDNFARTLFAEKKVWDAVSRKDKITAADNEFFRAYERVMVHALVDKDFRGDENQVLGLQDAIAFSEIKHLDFRQASYQEFKLPEQSDHTGNLLLISGSSGLAFLQKNSKFPENTKLVWSGHQLFPELNELAHLINLTILPRHAIDKAAQQSLEAKANLLLLDGVPHRIMKASLDEAKRDFEDRYELLPQLAPTAMLGVVLPGDAPDENGVMKFFTPDDARRLARNIVALEGVHKHYLVTNGPRTGSHDYESKVKLEPSPHRSNVVDPVTSAFTAELVAKGADKISLYDFQFSKLPSVYQAMLSLAADGMRIHIPGESTSMVTESTDVADNVVIDMVPSMNQDHHKHVYQVSERGAARYLTWDNKLQGGSKTHAHEGLKQTPAEIASLEIIKMFF